MLNVVGVYAGPAWIAPSTSPTVSFTVTRAATRTVLHLSASKVRYGHEQAEKISVVVTPAFTGSASGTVTVKAGKVTVARSASRRTRGAAR